MKNRTVTISMPIELLNRLHATIGKKNLSHFIVEAVQDKLEQSDSELEAAYAAANNDPDRKQTIDDWRALT